ncbi:uncharacterized protein LTR77_007631 [Saxophila tyrrhenica]|uniref:Uncharacterized protein n=1 Tax=Saxophila tyrrhenica TaxID=1690608 RepID=A0AAV9P605_9PEZI|nr:hypothetical protein LTR77_007631 [Saxophila tyrrhenica]
MTSSAVTKKPEQDVGSAGNQEVVESKEHQQSASASVRSLHCSQPFQSFEHSAYSQQAGLNLNVFGALSGAFSSKSTKETEADGSSKEVRQEQVSGSGAGAGNLNANAAASAEDKGRQMRAAIQEKNAS